MEEIKLTIVEDDPVIPESPETFMSAHPSVKITFTLKSMEAFLGKAKSPIKSAIEVLILDIGLPAGLGLSNMKMRAEQISAKMEYNTKNGFLFPF